MNTLGERLRLARDKKGLKQTQVKERTNINNKTLSGYENDVSEPDAKTLVILANLYEVSIDWLLGKAKNFNPENDGVFNPLEEIKNLADDLGIEDLSFFDIDEWKNLNKEDFEDIKKHFEFIAYRAKERKKEN